VCTAETSTGAAATNKGKFIESVVANNLFVIPLDTGDEWFRYHHQFQQLLLHELNKRTAPENGISRVSWTWTGGTLLSSGLRCFR
jgi:LuxR family maltose regulon positive regulatory protein